MKAETDESGTPGSLVGSTPLTSDDGASELVGVAEVEFEDFSTATFWYKMINRRKKEIVCKKKKAKLLLVAYLINLGFANSRMIPLRAL